MKEIIKVFEKRKQDLINTLRNHSEVLEPGKQHQLYGAINEIDVFLNTLYYYQDRRVNCQDEQFRYFNQNVDERLT
jgi:hypothetical protein